MLSDSKQSFIQRRNQSSYNKTTCIRRYDKNVYIFPLCTLLSIFTFAMSYHLLKIVIYKTNFDDFRPRVSVRGSCDGFDCVASASVLYHYHSLSQCMTAAHLLSCQLCLFTSEAQLFFLPPTNLIT